MSSTASESESHPSIPFAENHLNFPHALFYWRGKSLSPHRYSVSPFLRSFMRGAPILPGRNLPPRTSPPPSRRTVRLRQRTASPPPEFLPQPHRSRLRRHRRRSGKANSTLTNQLASGLATPTRVSPTFDLRSARLGDSPPTWSYLQPLTRPPNPATQTIGAAGTMVAGSLGDGSRAPGRPRRPPKAKALEGLGEAVSELPFSKRCLHPTGHCPLMHGTWLHSGETPDS